MADTQKTVTLTVAGCGKTWVARTPDGRTHIGKSREEAMAAAIAGEKARATRIVR